MEHLLPYFPPAIILFATLLLRTGLWGSSRSMGIFATVANVLALAVSVCLVFLVHSGAHIEVPLFQLGEGDLLRFSLRVDALTSLMLLLITGMSAVIHNYSIRYMDGETRSKSYFAALTLTAFGVVSFVLSSNLLQMFLCWHVAGFGLHQLLTFFKDRKASLQAARERLIVSRFGDVFLVSGMILAFTAYGSLDLNVIFARAALETNPYFFSFHFFDFFVRVPTLETMGALFALGAMTKSAQVPFHGWLPKTMEAPTTVSAFMHAGIINAGGFLIIRMSPIVAHSPVAMHLLFICGAITALFGGMVMLIQTDVKRKLAYSTIAQMGFMMMQCGLGAFTAALFHLAMHGLFKAYSFLSAGNNIAKSYAYQVSEASEGMGSRVVRGVVAVTLSAAVVFVSMRFAGVSLEQKAGGLMLLLFYGITVAQMIDSALECQRVLRPLGLALGFSVIA